VTPRARARACTTGAVLLLAAAILAANLIIGAGAIALWLVARSYRRQARRESIRAETLARPFPDPAPIPDWDEYAVQAAYDHAFNDIARRYDQETA
jgi:hypothetical protein